MDGVRMTKSCLDLAILCQVDQPGFRVRAGFDSGRGDRRDRNGAGVADAGEPAVLFLRANTAHHLVGITVGIGGNR
jgi:hypothetical protein